MSDDKQKMQDVVLVAPVRYKGKTVPPGKCELPSGLVKELSALKNSPIKNEDDAASVLVAAKSDVDKGFSSVELVNAKAAIESLERENAELKKQLAESEEKLAELAANKKADDSKKSKAKAK